MEAGWVGGTAMKNIVEMREAQEAEKKWWPEHPEKHPYNYRAFFGYLPYAEQYLDWREKHADELEKYGKHGLTVKESLKTLQEEYNPYGKNWIDKQVIDRNFLKSMYEPIKEGADEALLEQVEDIDPFAGGTHIAHRDRQQYMAHHNNARMFNLSVGETNTEENTEHFQGTLLRNFHRDWMSNEEIVRKMQAMTNFMQSYEAVADKKAREEFLRRSNENHEMLADMYSRWASRQARYVQQVRDSGIRKLTNLEKQFVKYSATFDELYDRHQHLIKDFREPIPEGVPKPETDMDKVPVIEPDPVNTGITDREGNGDPTEPTINQPITDPHNANNSSNVLFPPGEAQQESGTVGTRTGGNNDDPVINKTPGTDRPNTQPAHGPGEETGVRHYPPGGHPVIDGYAPTSSDSGRGFINYFDPELHLNTVGHSLPRRNLYRNTGHNVVAPGHTNHLGQPTMNAKRSSVSVHDLRTKYAIDKTVLNQTELVRTARQNFMASLSERQSYA